MAQYVGKVEKRPTATGSKSERVAVTIATPQGVFILRRRGGNAFADPALDDLIGRTIEVDGVEHGTTLIVSSWRVL